MYIASKIKNNLISFGTLFYSTFFSTKLSKRKGILTGNEPKGFKSLGMIVKKVSWKLILLIVPRATGGTKGHFPKNLGMWWGEILSELYHLPGEKDLQFPGSHSQGI